jgi:AraC-like DNA-binding protein
LAEAVAMATGFRSLSAFSRAYRSHFGYTARVQRYRHRTQRSLDFLPPINQSLVVDCRAEDYANQRPVSISPP